MAQVSTTTISLLMSDLALVEAIKWKVFGNIVLQHVQLISCCKILNKKKNTLLKTVLFLKSQFVAQVLQVLNLPLATRKDGLLFLDKTSRQRL